MDATLLITGIVLIAIAMGTLWIALPGADRISRSWLRSEAGGLYPLIPVILFVFGLFSVLKSFGLA